MLIRSLFNKNNKSKEQQIMLYWIPAHVGIIGNEHADQLAKKL
jgi:Ribonuclease HI